MMYDIVSKRYIFFAVSLLIIVPGLIALLLWGVKPSIDFTGGTVWEVVPTAGATPDQFKEALVSSGLHDLEDAAAQTAEISGGSVTTQTIVMRMRNVNDDERKQLTTLLIQKGLVAGTVETTTSASGVTAGSTVTATGTTTGTTATTSAISAGSKFAPDAQVQLNTVGPAIGAEVQEKAFLAVIVASLGILAYLWYAFRRVPNAGRYGACAIIALLHDALVVLGIFAILGEVFQIEVDALFITAMLTVIGFSVHDTIVVFDRIRENLLRRRFDTYEQVVNYSLLQTVGRSINTSLTVIFTLLALYLFGGASVKNFILALLVGIISGTYSSIFNASLLLVVWENKEWRNWFGRGKSNGSTAASARTA